mgnify:CR=1 FL=1
MRIEDLNWMDIEAYLQQDDRLIVVVGATEQHGYLSMLTDIRIPMALADSASQASGVLIAPPLNFGCSPYFLAYPGTFSLRVSTLIAVVEDLIRSARGGRGGCPALRAGPGLRRLRASLAPARAAAFARKLAPAGLRQRSNETPPRAPSLGAAPTAPPPGPGSRLSSSTVVRRPSSSWRPTRKESAKLVFCSAFLIDRQRAA